MNIIKRYYVKQFVHKIDKTIKVKFGRCLQCDVENATIYVNNKTDAIDVKTFNEYVQELEKGCPFNSLLLGILHEIGHIYTYDEDNNEGWNRDTNLLQILFQNDKISAEDFNRLYIRLPLEANATQWAVDFTKLNKSLCERYQKKIGKEFIKRAWQTKPPMI